MFGSENWNHMDARKEGMQQGEERNKEREKEECRQLLEQTLCDCGRHSR